MNFKFDINSKVVVAKQPEGTKENMIGLTGVIVDIDPDWVYPYEIAYDDGVEREVCLFSEDQLELLSVVEKEVKKANEHLYIDIKWQEGTVEENGVNGVQIEDVINILVDRLQEFQNGNFPCRENALAITKLEEARLWLNERTRKRREQGVEGKHKKHE